VVLQGAHDLAVHGLHLCCALRIEESVLRVTQLVLQSAEAALHPAVQVLYLAQASAHPTPGRLLASWVSHRLSVPHKSSTGLQMLADLRDVQRGILLGHLAPLPSVPHH
jgi:hypothetical protein